MILVQSVFAKLKISPLTTGGVPVLPDKDLQISPAFKTEVCPASLYTKSGGALQVGGSGRTRFVK